LDSKTLQALQENYPLSILISRYSLKFGRKSDITNSMKIIAVSYYKHYSL